MQLFGGKFNFPDGTPRHNYDTFMQAFVTVWQIITLTAWEDVLYDSVRAWGGSKWCYFYYLLVLVVAVYILFNVFIIIILGSFSQQYSETHEEGLANILQEDLIGVDKIMKHAHKRAYKEKSHGVTLHMHRSKKPRSMRDEVIADKLPAPGRGGVSLKGQYPFDDAPAGTDAESQQAEQQAAQPSNPADASASSEQLRWDTEPLPHHKISNYRPVEVKDSRSAMLQLCSVPSFLGDS